MAGIRRAGLKGSTAVLYVLPTAAGKTIVFTHFSRSAVARQKRVLVLVHRAKLLDQTAAALDLAGASYGVIASGYPETDAPVQIASVASLARPKRRERWRDRFDLVIVDEAHHAVAGLWAKVLESQPRARVLGVTATPERLDGRGLAERFVEIIVGPSTADLIAAPDGCRLSSCSSRRPRPIFRAHVSAPATTRSRTFVTA